MKTRIIVAAVGLPLLLLVLLVLPPVATGILVGAMSVIAVYELLYMTGLARNLYLLILSALMALAVAMWSCGGGDWTPALVGLWVYFAALAAVMLASHMALKFETVCISMFAGIFIPLMLSSLTRILFLEYGRFYVLIPLILAFSSDSGAYFAGCYLGKHKLAPVISPKKTWEGVAGGAAAAIVVMLLYALLLDLAFGYEVSLGAAILYGLVGTAVDVLGDLTFSVIKRQTGIKDYGFLLPGHGGILDRFDSMIFVAPLSESLILLLPVIVGETLK